MRFRPMVLCGALAAGLAAQGSDQGFQWVGFRAGSVSFDPRENAAAGSFLGGQFGMVFDQQRYGLSVEGFIAHPKNDFHPGLKLNHPEISLTWLSGLSDDTASRLWPYLGLGLGVLSYPNSTSAATPVESVKVGAAHASLGFLHRPLRGLVWGVEGRYLLSFTKDLKEAQVALLFGFTWGGAAARNEPVASRPPQEVKAPPPPPPMDVKPAPIAPMAPPPEKVVPPPPVPPPAVQVAPPPPPPAVKAPPPAPVPVAAPVPTPAPPAMKSAAMGSERAQRLAALRLGDLPKALELGRQRIAGMAPRRWTIRLEVADLPATLKTAANAFPAGEPDLFIAPINLKGGRTSYQLFLGEYGSKAEAERAAAAVPALFREGGQRPKPFLVETIPAQTGR